MSDVSSRELSAALSRSNVDIRHLDRALDVLERLHTDPSFGPADAAERALTLAIPLGQPKAISRSGASLFAVQEELGAEREINPAVAARQVLSLSRQLTGPEGEDLKEVNLGSFPSADQPAIQQALYDAKSVSDAEIAKLGGVRPVTELAISGVDQENAARVIADFKAGKAAEGFEGVVINALQALDVDAPGAKLEPAVGRIFAARRHSGTDLDVAEIASRVTGDLLLQMQAEKALDPEFQKGDFAIFARDDLLVNIRPELEAQAAGKFEKLPRGAQIDISDDLAASDFLPAPIAKSIDIAVRSRGINAPDKYGVMMHEGGLGVA